MRPTKHRLLEVVTYVVPGSDDVTYTHAVVGQRFLPIRKLPRVEKVLRGAPQPGGTRR
jgi:hypothetical protein